MPEIRELARLFLDVRCVLDVNVAHRGQTNIDRRDVFGGRENKTEPQGHSGQPNKKAERIRNISVCGE